MRPITSILSLALIAGGLAAGDAAPPAGGDGAARADRMKAAMEKMFTDGDKNADGKIDRAEFDGALAAYHAARAERAKQANRPADPAPAKEAVDAAFAKADANADGGLDKAELGEAMKALRPPRGGGKPAEGAAPAAPAAPPAAE